VPRLQAPPQLDLRHVTEVHRRARRHLARQAVVIAVDRATYGPLVSSSIAATVRPTGRTLR